MAPCVGLVVASIIEPEVIPMSIYSQSFKDNLVEKALNRGSDVTLDDFVCSASVGNELDAIMLREFPDLRHLVFW